MWYKFIYKTKTDSNFTFSIEGDIFNESTVIAKTSERAYQILKETYPHFRKNDIYLHKKVKLPNLFK